MQNLVIVESPTKARTLSKFLGDKYRIEASMGHIRDLPKSELGVDVAANFDPKYIIPRDKRKKANELAKLASEAETIWLASDPDREGEAIAWHLAELITSEGKRQKAKGKSNTPVVHQIVKRVVFHEITEAAIKDAFNHPRDIDIKLVDAQQARRVLDRLVGYKLSPLLWQKVKRGLSAGRVQSVALRLIVEREREVEAFKPVEYWSIEVELVTRNLLKNEEQETSKRVSKFITALIEQNGKKAEIKNAEEAEIAVAFLEKADYQVKTVTKKEVKRSPYPPFITSTLQQAASNKLGFSAKKTMSVAQALYERGLISYMRTDSVNLAVTAVAAAREYIDTTFGSQFVPASPRIFKSKSKNAQEAHEAIRPTDVKRQASAISNNGDLNRDHARLYDLIWKRFMACQMTEAIMDQTSIDVLAKEGNRLEATGDSTKTELAGPIASSLTPGNYVLRTTGSVIKFEGWLKVYNEGKGSRVKGEEDQEQVDEEDKILPELAQGQQLDKLKVLPGQHFTEPPPRYNEASLIKKLEELGIGRPSTYAPILSTLADRFYVERKEKKLIPTALGYAVIDFLMKYFSNIIDFAFTAKMEDELDEISRGERKWQPTIGEFYHPFDKQLAQTAEVAEKILVVTEVTDRICPLCGKPMIVRIGKFGKFLACSGFPECKQTESMEEKVNAKCPEDGGEILVRKTKSGKTFYGCKNWPNCKYASWTKPKEENRQQAIGDSSNTNENT